MSNETLRLININKTRGLKTVLDDFSLYVSTGEIVFVLGLSGSGKTTIANILVGKESYDDGYFYFEEKLVERYSESLASQKGIICLSNQTRLIPNLTLAENVFVIKRSKKTKLLISNRAINHQTNEYLKKSEIFINANSLGKSLPVALQHLVELVKAECHGRKLVIFDELTNNYTLDEYKTINKLMKKLADKGMSFIVFEGNTSPIIEVSHRVILLKKGRIVKELQREEVNDELISMVLMDSQKAKNDVMEYSNRDHEVLHIKSLFVTGMKESFDIKVHKGEILGILDSKNEINMEISRILTGRSKLIHGEIFINQKKVSINSQIKSSKLGIGLITAESLEKRSLKNMTLYENYVMKFYKRISNRVGIINKNKFRYLKKELAGKLGLEISLVDKKGKLFDEFILRQVIYESWLLLKPKILIIESPFAFCDIKSKEITKKYIKEMTSNGISVIIVTSNTEEIDELCHNTLIIANGLINIPY